MANKQENKETYLYIDASELRGTSKTLKYINKNIPYRSVPNLEDLTGYDAMLSQRPLMPKNGLTDRILKTHILNGYARFIQIKFDEDFTSSIEDGRLKALRDKTRRLLEIGASPAAFLLLIIGDYTFDDNGALLINGNYPHGSGVTINSYYGVTEWLREAYINFEAISLNMFNSKLLIMKNTVSRLPRDDVFYPQREYLMPDHRMIGITDFRAVLVTYLDGFGHGAADLLVDYMEQNDIHMSLYEAIKLLHNPKTYKNIKGYGKGLYNKFMQFYYGLDYVIELPKQKFYDNFCHTVEENYQRDLMRQQTLIKICQVYDKGFSGDGMGLYTRVLNAVEVTNKWLIEYIQGENGGLNDLLDVKMKKEKNVTSEEELRELLKGIINE